MPAAKTVGHFYWVRWPPMTLERVAEATCRVWLALAPSASSNTLQEIPFRPLLQVELAGGLNFET